MLSPNANGDIIQEFQIRSALRWARARKQALLWNPEDVAADADGPNKETYNLTGPYPGKRSS